MANPEHLEILKQGVDVWNRWREENPEVKPDLKFSPIYWHNIEEVQFFNGRFYHE